MTYDADAGGALLYHRWRTDRGNDNWLVKVASADEPHVAVTASGSATVAAAAASSEALASTSTATLSPSWEVLASPRLYIAAIDNGLSFPFKHPDSWRAYPFGWSFLPAARVPFSAATVDCFADRLADTAFVASLVDEMRMVMVLDAGFDERTFQRQMAVRAGRAGALPRAWD